MAARIAHSVPLGKMREPEEIAAAILYLASDDARNVSGEEIMIDGGLTGAPGGAPVYRG